MEQFLVKALFGFIYIIVVWLSIGFLLWDKGYFKDTFWPVFRGSLVAGILAGIVLRG